MNCAFTGFVRIRNSKLLQFKRIFARSFFVMICALQLLQPGQAAPGDLDVTFGAGGKVLTDFNGNADQSLSVVIQPDGKIVAAGYSISPKTFLFDYALARYDADGSLDTTFGNNGKVLTGFNVLNDFCLSLQLQSDGKIVAAGYVGGSGNGIGLARYNTNGSLDTSFNGNGTLVVFFNNGSFPVKAYAAAIQEDGKIIAVGSVRNGSDYDFALVRVNTNGTLDSSFDGDGRVTTSFSSLRDEGRSVGILPDGKILVAGYANNGANFDLAVAKYNANGTLDTSFDADGKITIPIGSGDDFGYAIGAFTDGGFLVAGESNVGSNFDSLLAKFNSTGQLDTTFGSSGIRLTSFGATGDDGAYSLAIQRNGKIITAGYTGISPNRDLAIARFDQNGTLDHGFNGNGKVVSDFGNADDAVVSVNLQRDGQIVVCGVHVLKNDIQTGDFLVARYQGDLVTFKGVFDFDGDGKTDLSIFRPGPGEWWYLKSSNGGNAAAQFGSGTDKITPGDFTGDGKTDIAFFRPGTGEWYVLRSEDQSFYSFPFGAAGDVPAPADYDGDGKTDAAVFRPSSVTWFISNSGGGTTIRTFGVNGDVPVAADYDGDAKADIAIYRPSQGQWWIQRSIAGTVAYQFGDTADKTVQGDYTGDGKADVAFWRPSTGEWFILRSEDNSYYSFPFGQSTDIAAPGDYDGDGKFDATVFRPSGATWYANRSTAGVPIQQFGQLANLPVPNAFVR